MAFGDVAKGAGGGAIAGGLAGSVFGPIGAAVGAGGGAIIGGIAGAQEGKAKSDARSAELLKQLQYEQAATKYGQYRALQQEARMQALRQRLSAYAGAQQALATLYPGTKQPDINTLATPLAMPIDPRYQPQAAPPPTPATPPPMVQQTPGPTYQSPKAPDMPWMNRWTPYKSG